MRAFVVAMECEAACVRPWLRPGDRLYVCGIGKVNAAAAAQQAICEGATEVWNAGLCGGFGDRVEVGCSSVLNPGTVIGRDSNIYPLSSVRGVVPAESIFKKQGEIVKKY